LPRLIQSVSKLFLQYPQEQEFIFTIKIELNFSKGKQ
jgi:hypothetical protein